MSKDKYNYYDEFIIMANCILESSEILNDTLNNYSKEKLSENVIKIHKLENDSDSILHRIKKYLIKDFLPPINREDVSLIGNMLDDIEDYIDEILINFNILDISLLKDRTFDFGILLNKCCIAVKETINDFKSFKKTDINAKIVEINKLEEYGDKIYETAMKELYTKEKDCIEIIRWTTIFNCFEDIILKNT